MAILSVLWLAGYILTKELLLVIDSDDKCLWKELEIYRSEYMEN